MDPYKTEDIGSITGATDYPHIIDSSTWINVRNLVPQYRQQLERRRGRKVDYERVLNGILFCLDKNIPFYKMPAEFGAGTRAYKIGWGWVITGVLGQILATIGRKDLYQKAIHRFRSPMAQLSLDACDLIFKDAHKGKNHVA